MSLSILSGLFVGLLFGFVLERGYFCQYSGLADALMLKNYRIVKATIWAILITMVLFHLMSTMGVISLNPKPLFWGANIVGGVIFGLGVVLVGGCAGGTTFKIGTGLISYLLAGIGIAIGGFITAEGFLSPYKTFLQKSTIIMAGKKAVTLDSIFGVNHWIIVSLLVIGFVLILYSLRDKNKQKEEISLKEKLFSRNWGPVVIGLSVGIIEAIAFIASAKSGRNYPIGIVEGYIPAAKIVLAGSFKAVNWMLMLILGIIAGSSIAAVLAKEFRLRLPKTKQIFVMPFGGFLLGVGAVTSGGCNITHVISGIPQLSIGSIISGLAIFGTIYLFIYFKFLRQSNTNISSA